MTQYRTDPLFEKMALVEGEWKTTIQLNSHHIPLSVVRNNIQWKAIYKLWRTIQQKLDEIQQEVAEVCHYDCSIEWGTDFPLPKSKCFLYPAGVHSFFATWMSAAIYQQLFHRSF